MVAQGLALLTDHDLLTGHDLLSGSAVSLSPQLQRILYGGSAHDPPYRT